MKNIFEKLADLLKEDERFVSDGGALLKNKAQELAYKNDAELIKKLLSDKDVKQHFFFEVEKTLIFDKEKFIRFISNKQFLPDSYTTFKNKIGLTVGDEYLSENKDVVLVWPYKDCVLEGGMTKEDQKRDEIFYNETLAPDDISRLLDAKAFTNFKRINKKGEQELDSFKRDEKGVIKDNLIIKGNNLLALASLQKEFTGKIKLIYVDPPYNTGGDAETFTYNNSFDHSTWLTFMKNRLEVAKKLLKEEGFVAITIDHCELFYLGALADEIFGRDNRIGIVSIVIRPQGRQFARFFSSTTEYMLVYAKDIKIAKFNGVILDDNRKDEYTEVDEKGVFKYEPLMYSRFVKEKLEKARDKYFYPIYVSQNLIEITLDKKNGYYEVWPINNKREICWKVQKNKFSELLNKNRSEYSAIKDKKGVVQIFEKYREEDGTKIKTHWIGKKYNATTSGTGILKELLGEKIFSYPKSLYAVLDTLKIMTSEDDIILDFFAGSGTTGHATLELNREDKGCRKFILVEQLDGHINVCKKRIEAVLKNINNNGSLVYMELAKWNEEWIKKIQNVQSAKQLIKLWDEMKIAAFLSYKINPKIINESAKDFADLNIADQKKFLIECLDKNQLYVNLNEMEDKEYGIGKEDKKLNKDFYQIK